jgi:hypothetical protein
VIVTNVVRLTGTVEGEQCSCQTLFVDMLEPMTERSEATDGTADVTGRNTAEAES